LHKWDITVLVLYIVLGQDTDATVGAI